MTSDPFYLIAETSSELWKCVSFCDTAFKTWGIVQELSFPCHNCTTLIYHYKLFKCKFLIIWSWTSNNNISCFWFTLPALKPHLALLLYCLKYLVVATDVVNKHKQGVSIKCICVKTRSDQTASSGCCACAYRTVTFLKRFTSFLCKRQSWARYLYVEQVKNNKHTTTDTFQARSEVCSSAALSRCTNKQLNMLIKGLFWYNEIFPQRLNDAHHVTELINSEWI